ncbi:MAG TPA: hypothetical protein VLX68_02330 [Chitinivibrionales bacterium]|nr:hypothetical protein [Chitinivibrionales bacterium]
MKSTTSILYALLAAVISGCFECNNPVSSNPGPTNNNSTTARFTVTGGAAESFTGEAPFMATYDANNGGTIFMGGGNGSQYAITVNIQWNGAFKASTFSSGGGTSGVLGVADNNAPNEWLASYDPNDAANAKGSYSLTITSMGVSTTSSGITSYQNPHGTLDATLECATKVGGPETTLHVDF